MKDTKQQFEHVIALCRDLFSKKLHDYGPAWRILRPASVTDQIFIKANRIRSIETKGVTLIDEGIRAEFIAIVSPVSRWRRVSEPSAHTGAGGLEFSAHRIYPGSGFIATEIGRAHV